MGPLDRSRGKVALLQTLESGGLQLSEAERKQVRAIEIPHQFLRDLGRLAADFFCVIEPQRALSRALSLVGLQTVVKFLQATESRLTFIQAQCGSEISSLGIF